MPMLALVVSDPADLPGAPMAPRSNRYTSDFGLSRFETNVIWFDTGENAGKRSVARVVGEASHMSPVRIH